MLLSEVANKNNAILTKALKVQELIAKQPNLNINIEKCKDAFLYYSATASLSTQKKAPLGDDFLRDKLNMEKVSPSFDRGDAKDSNGIYYEFKTSYTNEAQNLNMRQIRLWQDVNWYYCIYINEQDLDKSLFFVLSKEEMEKEVELCGGFTHGTAVANAVNQHSEYSITIPIYNDKNEKTKRWKEKYLSQNLKEKILYGN